MPIEMNPPRNRSSHIDSIGFDEDTGTLAVKFHKGGTYYYAGVSQETFGALHSSASPGSFFCSNIKGKIKPLARRS